MIPEQTKFTYSGKQPPKKPSHKKFTVADQLAVLRDRGRPKKGEEV